VHAAAIKNSDRWRHDLTSSQRDVLEALLYDDLRHYGYDVPQQESDTPALSGGLGI
jgi:hypothetical protein